MPLPDQHREATEREVRLHSVAEQGRRNHRRSNSPQDGRSPVSGRRERGQQDEGLEAHGTERSRPRLQN